MLYQGDEIGLGDSPVPQEDLRDPLGVLYWPAYAGRDAMRTPMQWRDAPGGGFTDPGTRPWLPLGPTARCNVEDQRSDPASVLWLTHDLISLRGRTPELQTGGYEAVAAPSGVWAWRRGDHILVVSNLTEADTLLPGTQGRVLIGTDRSRDDEPVLGTLTLRASEGVVVALR